jgi:hypothetical protein
LFRRPALSLFSFSPLVPNVGKRGTLTPRSPTLGNVPEDHLPVKGSVAPGTSSEFPLSLPRSCLLEPLVVLSRERGRVPEDEERTSPQELLRDALVLRGRCTAGECTGEGQLLSLHDSDCASSEISSSSLEASALPP